MELLHRITGSPAFDLVQGAVKSWKSCLCRYWSPERGPDAIPLIAPGPVGIAACELWPRVDFGKIAPTCDWSTFFFLLRVREDTDERKVQCGCGPLCVKLLGGLS